MSTDVPTFDDLPSEEQRLVAGAREVYEYFMAKVAPKLSASEEERARFTESPAAYLEAAGCPMIADLPDEKRAALDDMLATPPGAAQNIGCWICTKAIETIVAIVAVIGALVTAVIIGAIAAAIAGPAGLLVGIVVALIAEAGVAIGAELLGAHVEKLAKLVCQKTGAC